MKTLKGTWTFNDTLIIPSETIVQDVRFTTSPVYQSIDNGVVLRNGSMLWNQMTVYGEGTTLIGASLIFIDIDVDAGSHNTHPCYSVSDGWNFARVYLSMVGVSNGELLNGYGKTITFTEEQEVSDEFYAWFTENAAQAAVAVTYNGSTIAAVLSGQTATLQCAGLKMDGDVIVEVAEEKVQSNELDLSNIVEVESIDNPTDSSPSAVLYDGAIYLLVKESQNGSL